MLKMYSKGDCFYCNQARDMLINKNMMFEEIKVDQDMESRQWLVEQGFRSVPQIWNYDKHIGGYQDLKKFLEKENINVY